jgi:hypothetical protein
MGDKSPLFLWKFGKMKRKKYIGTKGGVKRLFCGAGHKKATKATLIGCGES